ncbi:unnamed protein product [Phaedon cochleariae]|uniref:C2H2-type domain-containing protein n=1 Tax=Phaedon cochleariae TaxID=80249 RepID=A0A9N9X0I9_PHACE|nr:unnamed protein product [Phaedon cochleariae]
MSVPSMVHRSGETATTAVRSNSDADQLKDLPDCKVKRNYTCAECDYFTQNPRVYLYHLRDAHDEKVKIYECPNCLYASRHFQKLLRHKKMVHGEQQVRDEEEEEEDTMVGRQEEAVQPAVYKCSVCEFSSRSQQQLTRHEREEHIKTKFFRCSKCTYVTHIKARYTKHVKYHSMPMIKCDMCDFRTPYKWNLDRHCKNHNGNGAFRCSACNFTADIKQSLTVHEMNHHVPPVGQAAGLGVGRRRNKVGASDATAAEEAVNQHTQVAISEPEPATVQPSPEDPKKPKSKIQSTKKTKTFHHIAGVEAKNFGGSDFINPDDIVSHANGKVYLKNKCKLCNFKTAWDSEMAKHERKAHNIDREESKSVAKKPPRPIPNLIPIPSQAAAIRLSQQRQAFPVLKAAEIPEPSEPEISQKDMNDICAKSSNSILKDFASLFGSEDVFKSTPKVPDLIPAAMYNNLSSPKSKFTDVVFKQKNASFFDSLREKLELGTGGSSNLTCNICGHESKCLTEQAKHQKSCGKEAGKAPNVIPMHNISSTRCQACRQRCKSSTDLYNHLQACPEAIRAQSLIPKEEVDSESEGELKIDIDGGQVPEEEETKPHPMENKVFVWNDILVPMDIEVDDSNYEYTEDKVDDNVSLDLSIRTQSPMDSDGSYLGQELNTPNSVHHSPVPSSTDKVPTHGNDISVAQHKRVFKCPHCTFWASTASRFHVHIVGHLNKKPFECSLCSYRSNWRWDITKHIKLKSVRDPAHESAKVLMTDETGRRNYTKYNKYLTEIPVSSDQSMDTSGGCGTRPKHHDRNASPSTSKSDLPKLNKIPAAGDFSLPKNSPLRPPPSLKAADKNLLAEMSDRKRSSSDGKRTLFKCKKCNFKDASRDVLLQHVKGHYQQQPQQQTLLHQQQQSHQHLLSDVGASTSAQDLRLRGTSPDRDEASVNNITGGKGSAAPFRCGHCNQVSNWKHVIQRHCRLKHSGDIRVVSNKNGHEKVEVEEITDEPDHIDITQEGTFKCNFCPFSNDDDAEFEQHLSGHVISPDNNVFKCYYCKFYVSHKEELCNHLRLHGVSDPGISKMLEKVTPENEGKKFRCTTCPYVTNSKSQYTYHKQFHKPRGGQYSCTHCSYNVSKRHLLHQHLKVHGINIATHKQNGESMFLDEITDEIEEVPPILLTIDFQNYPDIPLVWVSKNGKFSKMFKCRYCPHVNLRKVNIQEHEKMHSIREKNHNSNRLNDTEHRCTECNYVCNNAGVLSSHSKVHQGMYGIVHRLVDPTKTDEEQIKELSRSTGIQPIPDSAIQDDSEVIDFSAMETEEIDSSSGSGSLLYFCKECPARFLKENEFGIHKRFHGLRLFYKCDHCTYTSREKPHLNSHSKVHTNEYQDRTKVLQNMYLTSMNYPQPKTSITKTENGDTIWKIAENKSFHKEMSTLCSILSKPVKSSQNVPLSGTDLFLQKSEAEQKQAAEMINVPASPPQKFPDIDINELMRGNPEFIYQPYLKNGKLKEKRYKCHMCPTAFEKREQYKVHLGLHGSKQRYKCDHCDYSVKYYANFVQHLKKHKLNAEAHAARRPSDEGDLEVDESAEASTGIIPEDASRPLKPSLADQQVAAILQHREAGHSMESEERKHYWCPNCPYMNTRKDAVDNHQKRHSNISGVKSAYTCEHCDYSVPQSHFLKEHTKLHFMPNKVNQVEGFMICDNIKLTSNKVDEPSRMEGCVIEDDQKLIFEERGSELFLPSLGADVAERFNNNEGEKQFVNVQTGEIIKEEFISDIELPEIKEERKMEVN